MTLLDRALTRLRKEHETKAAEFALLSPCLAAERGGIPFTINWPLRWARAKPQRGKLCIGCESVFARCSAKKLPKPWPTQKRWRRRSVI